MRTTLFALLIAIAYSFPVNAQDATIDLLVLKPKEKKNEIGIMFENQFGNLGNNFGGFLNVMYKKWCSEHWGMRFIGSIGAYNEKTSGPGTIINDTIFYLDNHTNMDVYALGVGLDAQRRFYKKIYLTAACELRGGYGTGNTTSSLTREYFDHNDYKHTENFASSNLGDASMFFLSVTPYVGAKFQFKRLCVGAELSLLQTTFKSVNYAATRSTGMLDVNAGDVAHRIFLSYRF